MKIGLLTDNYPYTGDAPPSPAGGIGTYTRVVAEALARSGHEVHVFTFACVAQLRRIENCGVSVWQCPPWSKRREMSFRQTVEFTVRLGYDSLKPAPDVTQWISHLLLAIVLLRWLNPQGPSRKDCRI